MDAITLHSSFEPSTIKFSQVSKTNKGGKIIYLSFPNNERIKIQTPVMSAPFGISTYDDANNGQSHVLDASFKGYDTNPKLEGFLGKCREFDDVLLATATENSKAWLGKAMTKEVTAEFLRRSVREANDPSKYAPTLRMKITPSTEFYNERQETTTMDYVTKGTSFRAILELASVWFVNKNYGVTWRVAQLAVVSRPDRLTGFAFRGEDDPMEEDDDHTETAAEF